MFGGLKSLAQPISDTIHRIRAVLAQIYGVYPRSGGGIVVRQPGGTAGTDEVQMYHDGTDFTIENKEPNGAADIIFKLGGGEKVVVTRAVGLTAYPLGTLPKEILGQNEIRCASDVVLGITGDTNVNAALADISLYRLAAGVFGIGSGAASGAMWLQNSGGRSRVSSNVTNTGITPANITGLSATLIAGRKYTGRLVLYASVPTSADGIRIDFDGGTATMTSFIAQGVLSDDTSTRKLARTTALATDITDTDLNGEGYIVIEFGLVCNGAGTFIPRIAKEADAAGDTLTVTANSFMWLEDMP